MSGQSKLKTLYVMKFLYEESSETNVLSAADLSALLSERCGIDAERKGIYADIEVLREFGLDIRQKKGSNPGYYIVKEDVPAKSASAPESEEKKEITVDIPFKSSGNARSEKAALKDMSRVGSISYLVKDKKGNSSYALKISTDVYPYRVKVKDYVKDPDSEPSKKKLDASAMNELRELCDRLEKI